MKRTTKAISIAVALAFGNASAYAGELLSNGDFEAGSFAGWSTNVLAGSNGNLFIDAPGTSSPQSGFATSGAGGLPHGSFYAVTDQSGPGTYSLTQSFTVAAGASQVILSFDLFANDQSNAGPIVNPAGLTHVAGSNQHARVDVLTGVAGAFDTGAAVLQNFYLGVDAGADPHPFTHYSFDITALVGAGGTFQIRFGEVDNQGNFQMGVDNVSIQSNVPVPGVLGLLGLGLAGIGFVRRSA